jgi:hypothetical protein
MADDSRSDFIREILSAENKYIYYVLAATGACIAFAINKTDQALISWSHIPWVLAVLCWAISLYFGTRILMNETEYMADVALVDMTNQADPNFQPDPQFEARRHRRAQRKGQYKWWQFTLLLAGAAFFMIWHVLEMFLRTAESE